MSISCCRAVALSLICAFFSNAMVVPVSFRLFIAGLLAAGFLFLPWSTNLLHIVFIVISFVLGVVLAVLHWCLSRRRSTSSQFQEEDTVGRGAEQNSDVGTHFNDIHILPSHEHSQFWWNDDRRCCTFSLLARYGFIFPIIELFFLGLLVLLSSHVMTVNTTKPTGFTTLLDDEIGGGGKMYPIGNVWKVWYLHLGFLFAFKVPFIASLVVGLAHFAVLMIHFNTLNYFSILVSLLWFVMPLICSVVLAVHNCGQPRFWSTWPGSLWSLSEVNHISQGIQYRLPGMSEGFLSLFSQRDVMTQPQRLNSGDRQPKKVSSFAQTNHDVANIFTPMISRCWQMDSDINCAQAAGPILSEGGRHGNGKDISLGDPQAPYLLLSSSGNNIIGASMSFATQIGMTVSDLMGQKLINVLKKLEVENIETLMEVIRAANSSSPKGGETNVGNREILHGRTFSKTDIYSSVSRKTLQDDDDDDVSVGADGCEYSVSQGIQSPLRIGDRSVHRILLRGRYTRRSPSVLLLQLIGNKETSLCSSTENNQRHSFAPESVSSGVTCFTLTLDVWLESQHDGSGGFVVLRQPLLHHALERVPLPCFLVHPLTGRVLYWSRTAELRTGKLAYDMVGWTVHADSFPGSLNSFNRHHDLEQRGEGHARLEKRSSIQLESPLWAVLHMPFTLADPLVVTLQPLSGDFVESESTAMRNGVRDLVWPPHHFSRSETCVVTKGSEAINFTCGAGEYSCRERRNGIGTHTKPSFGGCLPHGNVASADDTRGKGSEWYFNFLAENGEAVPGWFFSGVPLLFLIHSEVQTATKQTVDNCEGTMHDFMHAVCGALREFQSLIDNLSGVKAKEIRSMLAVGEDDVSLRVAGQLRQLKGMVDGLLHEVTFLEGSQVLGAITKEYREKDSKNSVGDGNDDEGSAAKCGVVDCGDSNPPPTSVGDKVSGLTPTLVSMQTAAQKNSRLFPVHDILTGDESKERDNVAIIYGDSNGDDHDSEDGGLNSGLRENGGSVLKTHASSSAPSVNRSKNVPVPRLISPLPHELAGRKVEGDIDARQETYMPEKNALEGDSALNSQQHFKIHQYHEYSAYHHHLVSPLEPSATLFPGSSTAVLNVSGEVVASPAMGVGLSHEKPQIWAMLRSSDEATIPSCFISVPFGEEFCFGRSSKCHAMATDAFVSSIQFTIVRQQCPQFQYVTSSSQEHLSTLNPDTNCFVTSSLSGPHQFVTATGNCIIMLYDNSVNGTYVNVRKVSKGKPCVLRDRDLITFRLSSSSFFSGFQFLLTDGRGVPLQEKENSSPQSGTECHMHNNSNNMSGGGSNRCARTGTRSRNSGASGRRHHCNRIEWKIGEEMLGKGGNAEVYLGINLTNGKLIAVKRVPLPPVGLDDSGNKGVLRQYRSLQEEINVLSKAVHPNIVQYYGSSRNKEYFNILLEFVSGGSLRHLLDNFGKLSPGVICSYLRQTLEGLRYLHHRNIVHSDLKAANILVTDKGRVKLSDFGTAKPLNKQPSQSLNRVSGSEHCQVGDAVTCRLAGTLLWMAPELVRGPGDTGPTRASDIWSVGCVLIEMISSNVPWYEYEFESEEQIINLLKYTTERPKVPECGELPELTAIAKKCLTLAPEERPTCEELLHMVENAAEHLQPAQTSSLSPHDPSVSSQVAAPAPLPATLGNDTVDNRVRDDHEVSLQCSDSQ